MAPVCAVEYRKDTLGEKLYASRNHNQLRHTYDTPSANRSGVDWNLTLRQVRKKHSGEFTSAASVPDLQALNRVEGHRKEPLVPEHQDGEYFSVWANHGKLRQYEQKESTVGKYQNFGSTEHMLNKVNRVSSGQAFGIDWQLNLRNGTHAKSESSQGWRRYFTRPQVTFDLMKENCSKDNEAYQKSHITPQDRRMDPWSGAISVHTIRHDPVNWEKFEGCEGANVSQWRHLIEDRRHGHKARRQLQQETTLRYQREDQNGAKISESRSEGCITEMLGKKKWLNHVSHEPLAQRAPEGDVMLYHRSRHRILPEADEENREKRRNRCMRKDMPLDWQNIPTKKKIVREPVEE